MVQRLQCIFASHAQQFAAGHGCHSHCVKASRECGGQGLMHEIASIEALSHEHDASNAMSFGLGNGLSQFWLETRMQAVLIVSLILGNRSHTISNCSWTTAVAQVRQPNHLIQSPTWQKSLHPDTTAGLTQHQRQRHRLSSWVQSAVRVLPE